MPLNLKLNLKGILSPLCLLKCKSVLAEMDSGEVLEVSLQDPNVAGELTKIVERSQDQVIKTQRAGDHYQVHIKKY